MRNCNMTVKGDVLTITVNLKESFGPSASGKSIAIASTDGNQAVPGFEAAGFKIGLNVYKPNVKA